MRAINGIRPIPAQLSGPARSAMTCSFGPTQAAWERSHDAYPITRGNRLVTQRRIQGRHDRRPISYRPSPRCQERKRRSTQTCREVVPRKMPKGGLEPPRPQWTLEPESSASANSAISAGLFSTTSRTALVMRCHVCENVVTRQSPAPTGPRPLAYTRATSEYSAL